MTLYDGGGRVLLSWCPAAGMHLAGFAGLVVRRRGSERLLGWLGRGLEVQRLTQAREQRRGRSLAEARAPDGDRGVAADRRGVVRRSHDISIIFGAARRVLRR